MQPRLEFPAAREGSATSASEAPSAAAPLFPLPVYLATAAFGAVLLLIILAFAMFTSGPIDEFRQNLIRPILALGCACVAILLPGMATFKQGPSTAAGRAAFEFTGPIAVFAMVFLFFKPASWRRQSTAEGSQKKDRDAPADVG